MAGAAALVALAAAGGTASAEVKAKFEAPEVVACPAVPPEDRPPVEDPGWNACERWAWSCIRKGLEVHFYANRCFEPRSKEGNDSKERFRYTPFYKPDRYKDLRSIGPRFLFTILTRPEYANDIQPIGVRLFGAYFEKTVNLENVTTNKNIALDQSIFKGGLRFTNFKSERNLSLDGANVRGRVYLLRAQIGGTLFMENGVFDLVDASDARFHGSVDAPGAVFNAPLRLDRVQVEGKVSLIRSRLTELTAFDTSIGSKLELRYAQVRGRIDLSGIKIAGDLRMQRLGFGRERLGDTRLTCDWALDDTKRFFLNPETIDFGGQPDIYADILEEAIYSRPGDRRPEFPCLNTSEFDEEGRILAGTVQHEVLLRDMKIGGSLCMIDITGRIESGRGRAQINSIALDGTEAHSTVVRWAPSDSTTMWQVVHFKTQNLFVDLASQPQRHFLDNLDIGNITFLRPILRDDETQEQVEESRSFLCDVPAGPAARFASDDLATHQRIIEFFTSDKNQSKSAQPFAEIVHRLEESGAASTTLKVALSEYKSRATCSGSEFFKRWEAASKDASYWEVPGRAWAVAGGLMSRDEIKTFADRFDEARRIGMDLACVPMLAAYKYGVNYGHEPLNVIYFIIGFVVLFWLLLSFDTPSPGALDGRPAKLGILYAIDMFNPFTQVQLNRDHSKWSPNARWLKVYLKFHRLVGLVLCLVLAVGLYTAGR